MATTRNPALDEKAGFREPPTAVRFVVLGCLCAAAMIAYIDRGCLAVPTKRIQKELALSVDEMANVMFAFYLAYAFFQLPGGWFTDRWGSRRSLTVLAIVWSGATALLGFGVGLWSLAVCQFVNGAAQAGLFPGCVNTISKWFPSHQRAFPSGALGAFMSVGAVITTTVTAALLNRLDWRTVFWSLSSLGVIWAIGFYFWFRDRPQDHRGVNGAELAMIQGTSATPEKGGALPTPWGILFSSPQMWLIAGQQFCRSLGYVFYQTWMPRFLMETRNVTEQSAGFLTSVTVSGVVLGSTLGGFIADLVLRRTGSRRLARQGLAIVGLVSSAGFVFTAYFVPDANTAAVVMACGAFCAGAAGPAAYTITMDVGGKHVSTIFSTMNMAGNIGGMLSPKLVGWLVYLTDENWNVVLLMFAAVYLLGAICWVRIDPNRPIVAEAV